MTEDNSNECRPEGILGKDCRTEEILANLKCPNCFSKKLTPCEDNPDEKASCESCDCEFEFNDEFPQGGMD